MLDNYYTVNEAAKVLRIHPDTLKRLCRQGDVLAVKIRNTWLIEKDRLETFAATYHPRKGAKRRLL